MCGICGFIGRAEEKEQTLQNMMNAIVHRGPDSSGTYVSELAALGFRRLSIIDLENGTQPMHNEDGNLTLVFNGEIYNYRRLRKILQEKGHTFENNSDSETLLHGYESYGKDLLRHLRGMFGFAIWDEAKKKLFMARDFFGIKPVYYAIVNGNFVFGSEIKSILQYPEYKKELNETAMEQYLTFQYSVLEETFFKGIYKLMPGCCLTWENGQVKTERYFDPVLTPKNLGDDEKVTKKIEEVLLDSVEAHMVSDVEVGAFLSGGVDSSFIAAKYSGNKAFTVGFLNEENHYSEIHYAQELAKELGLEHHTKIIKKNEYWEAIPKVMYHLDEPSGDAAAIALYFVAQEASKYVKVVTSGEGADEMFGGYRIYMEPQSLKWVSWMPRLIRRGISSIAKRLPDIKGRDYLIRAGLDVEERFIGNARIFSEAERKEILNVKTNAVSPKKLLAPQYQKIRHLKDMDKMQQVDINYWLQGDILQKADKMSMAHSLELRVPFLDRKVFALAKNLPMQDKVRDHQTKYLFRRATEKYLPKKVAQMKKLGFPVPIRIWIKEEPWLGEIREMFQGQAARKYFDTDKLMELLEEHVSDKKDNSRKIWTVFVFLVWYRVFFEEGQTAASFCAEH